MCMLTYSKEITSVEKVLKLEMSEGWFGKLAREMVEGEDAVSAVEEFQKQTMSAQWHRRCLRSARFQEPPSMRK